MEMGLHGVGQEVPDDASVRRAPDGRQRMVLPTLVLAVGIGSSVLLFSFIRDAVESVARLRFERQASDAHALIEGRFKFYTAVLYGARALFASRPVDRVQFHRYVESLDLKNQYPGFDIVNYAVHVVDRDKNRFEQAVRRDTSLDPEGYPNFSIRPAGRRPEYWVMIYLEPIQGSEFAFGVDLGANPSLKARPDDLAGLQRTARDSGRLTASGLPIRVKDQIFLAMRLAVYGTGMPVQTLEQRRAAYLGSVGAGINLERMLRATLDEKTMRSTRIQIYDAGAAGPDRPVAASSARRLVFDTNVLLSATLRRPQAEDSERIFVHSLPMEVAGRIWELDISAEKKTIIERVDELLPWMVLLGGVLFSTLLFIILYFLASSRSRAVAIAADMTKHLRESQEQLQALSRRLVEVQEIERRRLSSELHDRVGQNLTALSINLDILKTRMPASADEEVASRLDDSQHLLGATADTIDNVMSELRPPMLDDYGLHAALDWHARDFTKRTGVEVNVRGDERGERPLPEIEITLFRIAQEALNNVAKHAHARHVAIVLEFRPGECIMSVADDGRGFPPARPAGNNRRQGVGMVTMRERAQAVGGSFEVRPAPGGGTQIIVRVPR
jgi:signal transduction histidine kinase